VGVVRVGGGFRIVSVGVVVGGGELGSLGSLLEQGLLLVLSFVV
jgi:hypothetical protein